MGTSHRHASHLHAVRAWSAVRRCRSRQGECCPSRFEAVAGRFSYLCPRANLLRVGCLLKRSGSSTGWGGGNRPGHSFRPFVLPLFHPSHIVPASFTGCADCFIRQVIAFDVGAALGGVGRWHHFRGVLNIPVQFPRLVNGG